MVEGGQEERAAAARGIEHDRSRNGMAKRALDEQSGDGWWRVVCPRRLCIGHGAIAIDPTKVGGVEGCPVGAAGTDTPRPPGNSGANVAGGMLSAVAASATSLASTPSFGLGIAGILDEPLVALAALVLRMGHRQLLAGDIRAA